MAKALTLHPKVASGALGGWVTTLILYSLDYWAGINPPAVVGAALLGVVVFVCGYIAPPE